MTGGTALFVGDIGLDISVSVSHVPAPDEKVIALEAAEAAGGVVANAAVACSRAEGTSRILCATGSDLAGTVVLRAMTRNRVAVDSEQRNGATCRALILLEPSGEKRLVLVPGVSMYPSVEQVADVDLNQVRWVHTAAYDLDAAALLVERCRTAEIPWSLDLEPATMPEGLLPLRHVLSGADTVFVNRHAAEAGDEPIAETLKRWGVKSVVLSLGADGARLTGDGMDERVSPPSGFGLPNSIRDTTGAGDCLAGWYVAERLRGSDLLAAANAAVTAATLSCLGIGAQQSYPDREAVVAALLTTNE